MRSTLVTVAALLVGFGFLQMGNALQGTLLSVRAGLEGFSAMATGLVMSGFFAGMAVGSFLAPRVIERAGHSRAFAALASLASAAALVHLLFVEPWAWIAVRTMTGFCFAGLVIIVESWLNASIESERRGQLLSLYAMAGLGAGAVGQFLLSAADPAGFALFAMVSIILSLALVPVAISRARAPMPDVSQAPPSVSRLYRISPFGCVAALLTGATIGSFFGLTPLFAQEIGFAQGEIAVIMALATAGALMLQWPLGWISDRMSRRTVSVALAATAAAVCALVTQLDVLALAPSLGLAFLVGGVLLPNQSLVVAHVNDQAPPDALLATSGGLVLMNGIGAAAGPLVGGVAMDALGPAGLLYFLTAAQGGIAIFGLYRMLRRAGPTSAEKGEYSPSTLQPVEGDLELHRREQQIEFAF